MTTQQPTIEERISRIEGSYERVGDLVQQFEGFRAESNARFRDLSVQIENARAETDRQFENARAETDRRFENARAETNRQLDSMRAEMNSAVRNLYVIIGGSWATLMATIIGLNLAT